MSSPRHIDLAGEKFGRLSVIKYSHTNKRNAFWLCRCDCGSDVVCKGTSLRYGSSQSCGCLRRERAGLAATKRLTVHGHTASGNSRTYRVWANMMTRCYNPNADAYKWYGARGIEVCEEWKDFSVFLRDMGEAKPGYTLDRKDGALGYSKGNCRWATQKEQCNNQRTNRILTIDGTSKSVAMWAEEPGAVNVKLIYDRLYRGWSHKEAVFDGVRVAHRRRPQQ